MAQNQQKRKVTQPGFFESIKLWFQRIFASIRDFFTLRKAEALMSQMATSPITTDVPPDKSNESDEQTVDNDKEHSKDISDEFRDVDKQNTKRSGCMQLPVMTNDDGTVWSFRQYQNALYENGITDDKIPDPGHQKGNNGLFAMFITSEIDKMSKGVAPNHAVIKTFLTNSCLITAEVTPDKCLLTFESAFGSKTINVDLTQNGYQKALEPLILSTYTETSKMGYAIFRMRGRQYFCSHSDKGLDPVLVARNVSIKDENGKFVSCNAIKINGAQLPDKYALNGFTVCDIDNLTSHDTEILGQAIHQSLFYRPDEKGIQNLRTNPFKDNPVYVVDNNVLFLTYKDGVPHLNVTTLSQAQTTNLSEMTPPALRTYPLPCDALHLSQEGVKALTSFIDTASKRDPYTKSVISDDAEIQATWDKLCPPSPIPAPATPEYVARPDIKIQSPASDKLKIDAPLLYNESAKGNITLPTEIESIDEVFNAVKETGCTVTVSVDDNIKIVVAPDSITYRDIDQSEDEIVLLGRNDRQEIFGTCAPTANGSLEDSLNNVTTLLNEAGNQYGSGFVIREIKTSSNDAYGHFQKDDYVSVTTDKVEGDCSQVKPGSWGLGTDDIQLEELE